MIKQTKFNIIFTLLAITVVCLSLCSCDTTPHHGDQPEDVTPFPLLSSSPSPTTKQPWSDSLKDITGLSEKNFAVKEDELQPLPDKNTENIEYFSDVNGTEYGFDRKNGKLVDIYKPDIDRPEQTLYSVSEMGAMADIVIAELIDVHKYEQTYSYQADTMIHKFKYIMIIDGYETTECGFVWLTNSGTVASVSVYFIGKFDNVSIPLIDEEKLDAEFDIVFHQKYGDNSTVTDIHNKVIDLEDNQWVMIYDFDYDYYVNEGVILYERSTLRIPVE